MGLDLHKEALFLRPKEVLKAALGPEPLLHRPLLPGAVGELPLPSLDLTGGPEAAFDSQLRKTEGLGGS